MTEAINPENLREAYDQTTIPKPGTPERKPHTESDDETEVAVNVGDVIERRNTRNGGTVADVRYVLEVYDHGLVVWILDDERYTYYPSEFLREDLSEYDLRVHEDPWGLREDDE
ncbi:MULTISPECIES: hypothetical protein [Haloferacaceae]|uniref:Uncharacterized protein n=2 Tax=Haloferacaceae TaxID=1644056 RepID=A0ABD6DDF1_9EURY|nr:MULTISPECIES: hypothetical protein [Halorubraceae]